MSQTCVTCDQFLIKPLQTNCGHNVCAICIQGNNGVLKKIKHTNEINLCKRCKQPITVYDNVNIQFDELLKESNPKAYRKRTLVLNKTKLIPELLSNLSKCKMTEKIIDAITIAIQTEFDTKNVYFLDKIVNMVSKYLITFNYSSGLDVMIRSFVLTELEKDNNVFNRFNINSFNITCKIIKKPIWVLMHKDMWENYLGGTEFDFQNIEYMMLTKCMDNEKMTLNSKDKSLVGRRFLNIALKNNQIADPYTEYPDKDSMKHFLTTNIDTIINDPDFKY